MKKVLFLINTLDGGGAEKVLVNLANNIDKKEYEVTIKTLFNVGINKNFIKDDVIYKSVFNKPFKGYNYVFNFMPHSILSKYIVKEEYDIIVVYLHGILTKIISKYKKSKCKKIAWIHADMNNTSMFKLFRNMNSVKSCFKEYDHIIGVSNEVSQSFIHHVGLKEKVQTKYNTFDVENIKEKSKQENKDIDKSTLSICSVGKLIDVKGYDRLIRVSNRLIKEGFTFKLYIVGEGKERENLEKYIKSNSISENIILTGFKTNPYKYIVNSDIFVSSSISEGFSSVVVEAILLGVPVITTKCAGMEEILGKNNEYGLIVDNEENALYEGLKLLIENKNILNEYKQKAKERQLFFSIEKTVSSVEELFAEE